MSNYYKRKVDYFDDKIRYNTIYDTDFLKTLKEENYKKSKESTIKNDLDKYQYSYDPTLVQMAIDKNICKDENYVRNRL